MLVAIVFSSDFREVCVICLFKFYPKFIVAVICVISAESALPCCCPKCLLEVVNIYDTPASAGKQAIAGMLETARIPAATGMPALSKAHQQEKAHYIPALPYFPIT